MAQTSSGSLASPGGLLFGALLGAFTTVVATVGTYTLDVHLSGRLISIYLLLGLVVALAAAVGVTQAD